MNNRTRTNPVIIAFFLAFVIVGLALFFTFVYFNNTQSIPPSQDPLLTFLIVLGIANLLVITGTFVTVNIITLIYRLRIQPINNDTKVYKKMAAELEWHAMLASVPRTRKTRRPPRRSNIISFPTT